MLLPSGSPQVYAMSGMVLCGMCAFACVMHDMCDVPRTKESYADLAKQVRDALVRFNNCLSALKPPGLKCTCLLAQSPIQTLSPKAETPKTLIHHSTQPICAAEDPLQEAEQAQGQGCDCKAGAT